MPDPSTTRLALYKSKSDGSELVNYTQDIGQNLDKIDAAVGYQSCTSSTRPSSPYSGKPIMETDTSYRTYFSNGTAPASASWVEIPNSSATFNNNLKLASGKQININASGSTASIAVVNAATTTDLLSARVTGDTADRFLIDTDGTLNWGAGASASPDVKLYRSAADTLKTDDSLIVTGALTASGIGQRLRAYKTANETVTSSTTLQNDDHLTVTLDANSVYRIYMVLLLGGVTAGEIKTSWTVPASATGYKSCMGPGSDSTSRDAGATTTMRYGTHNFTTTINYGVNDAANFVHTIEQGVVTTTTGGTFVLQWAQQASSGTASTIAAGSFLIAEKIA